MAEIDDETLGIADQAKMAMEQLREVVSDILCERLEPEQCEELAERLSEGRWTHDFPITPEHARKLGLVAAENIPRSMLQLMELYPQPIRRQPSVEYLPGPRKRRQRRDPESAGE